MNTQIYIADTDALEDRALFDSMLHCVSQQRREAISRYRFEKDRRLSLGAGLLFNKALSNLGIDGATVRVAKNEYGKPYLPDCPGVFINLSHSGSRAMCAVSEREIGCDTELIAGVHTEVAERYFTPGEREYIAAGTEGDNRRFYRIWTLKESFMKAVGAGLHMSLSSFSVSIGDAGVGLEGHDGEYDFFEPRLYDAYSYACCVKGRLEAEPELIITDLSCL